MAPHLDRFTWSDPPNWFDAVSIAAQMTGISMDQYLSTIATVAADKSEMTVEEYLTIVGARVPSHSILMTEAPASIFIWHDASEAKEPYCEEVPTNGLKLATNSYGSTDGELCAHGLRSPESREAWVKTCHQKALFMGEFVDNTKRWAMLALLTICSYLMVAFIFVIDKPTSRHCRTGRRPWRGLIQTSIFVMTMLFILFLGILTVQSFCYCDPSFDTHQDSLTDAYIFIGFVLGGPLLIHVYVWIEFLSKCVAKRPAPIQQERIELSVAPATSNRQQEPQSKPSRPGDVPPACSECSQAERGDSQAETGDSQAPPPYAAEV